MRWGETIGLEHGYVHDDEIHVEWQLREIRSTFHRLPPKDDSYRSPNWEPCLPVDLPPFLSELLARTGPPLPGLGLDLLGQQVRQERREVDGQAGFQWGLR